jgi:hypothetical protein
VTPAASKIAPAIVAGLTLPAREQGDRAGRLSVLLRGSVTHGNASGGYVCAPGGEYYLYVLWGSQEEADAAAGIMAPRLQHHLAGNAVARPDRRLYPVIESA